MFRNKTKQLLRDEQGSVTIVVAGLMMALVAMAALAVDSGHLYAEETMLQASADSAAMAAALALSNGGDQQDAEDAAIAYARNNMPTGNYGNVLRPQDVVWGEWNSATRSFSAGGDESAVQVTLRRTAANGNQATSFFTGVFKSGGVDITARAVAVGGSAACEGGTMFMAEDQVSFGQDMYIGENMCVYGRNGVNAGQAPTVEEGAFVGALDITTIEFGQDPSVPDGAVGEADLEATLAVNMQDIIDDLEAGVNLPPQITSVEVLGSLPNKNNIVAGTAYVINGNVSFNQNYTLTDVIVAATGNIDFGQDGRVINSQGTCGGGGTAIGLYALGNIDIGQDAEVEGVQLVARGNVKIGQDLRSFAATIEAGQNLDIDQDPNATAIDCASAVSTGGGGGTQTTARLVQ